MTLMQKFILLLTGLTALYLIWQFYGRYSRKKALYDVYYMTAFAVLFVSGVLLIFGGWGLLNSPYVLTVASLIPLSLAMGLVHQFLPQYKKAFSWFALIGLIIIAITSIGNMSLKSAVVPLFHGVAGLIIFLVPIYRCFVKKVAPKGFGAVALGGVLISIGGMALAFLKAGKPLFGILDGPTILAILAPLLFLMTLAYTWGFMKDIKHSA